jgi:hypothetical protein
MVILQSRKGRDYHDDTLYHFAPCGGLIVLARGAFRRLRMFSSLQDECVALVKFPSGGGGSSAQPTGRMVRGSEKLRVKSFASGIFNFVMKTIICPLEKHFVKTSRFFVASW